MNSIRISGGNLKGKKVYFDFNDSLRPTSNKLREILFNWIHFDFKQGFECLDLFAGTGALGFEAISRNANKVTFIELNKKHYLNIKKNISKLGLQDCSKIFFIDAFSWISKNDLSNFDLIIIDPPFNMQLEEKILKKIISKNELKKSCKIYLEFSKFSEIEVPSRLKILKEKKTWRCKSSAIRNMKLRLGTRKSELALFQANYVSNKLSQLGVDVEIIPIVSEGDIKTGPLHEIGGKGLFVNKLEEALLKDEIDCAVHSLKDVPAKISNKFIINAVLPRESYADILVMKNNVDLLDMPDGAKIGTSSPRRAAQILNMNPNLKVEPIRGNIATRLSKLSTQDYDAIIVAEAALNRLEIVCEYSTKFKISEMLPSASQGYIGVQCLNVKNNLTKVIESVNSETDMILANAERSFVAQLDGSCTSPICILCTLVDERVQIQAKVISLDGKRQIAKSSISSVAELDKNIVTLADQFISEGARSIIL